MAGREVFPSASVGIALWHPRYRTGAELLRDADAAMYRAKAGGRDRCAVFDEAMREDAMRILDLEGDLRRAINGDGFTAFYQPIVRLGDNRVIGHEALLRWRHERRGLLMPGEFIGLGEDSGLIEEVDWLIYARWSNGWPAAGDGYISVNVSPRHFRSADFADRLLRMIDTAGADPQPAAHRDHRGRAARRRAARPADAAARCAATACWRSWTTSAPASRRCRTCIGSRSSA